MIFQKYIIPAFVFCALVSACVSPKMRVYEPEPVFMSDDHPVSKKEPAALRLSAEQTKKIEQLYYKAVGAYSNNEMAASGGYLKEIFAIHPSYPPALELKKKISLAAGQE